MADLASTDKILYTLNYSQLGQRFMNTFWLEYFDVDGAVDNYAAFGNAYLEQAADTGQLIDDLKVICNSQLTFVDHRFQRIRATRMTPIIQDIGVTGSQGDGESPINVAGVATKRGEVSGRWAVGSWHQPGLYPDAFATAGNLTSAYKLGLNEALNNWFNTTRTPPGMVGNVRPILFNNLNPTRVTSIVTIQAQDTVRVMRRRTVGLGI